MHNIYIYVCHTYIEMGVKTKEEEFEKVVRWRVRPRYVLIFVGVLNWAMAASLFTLMVILSLDSSERPLTSLEVILIFAPTMIAIFLGLAFFVEGLGEGRRVTWKKIRGCAK